MTPDTNKNVRAEITIIIAAVLLGFIAVVALVLALTRPAHSSPVCLTKREARVLWPRQHIYWYSGNHCWSNRRGGPPRNIRYDLIREDHAQSLPAPPDENPAVKDAGKGDRAVDPPTRRGTVPTIKIVKAEDYNEMDAQVDADLFFNALPVPFWHFSALDDGFDTWKRRVEDLLK